MMHMAVGDNDLMVALTVTGGPCPLFHSSLLLHPWCIIVCFAAPIATTLAIEAVGTGTPLPAADNQPLTNFSSVPFGTDDFFAKGSFPQRFQ